MTGGPRVTATAAVAAHVGCTGLAGLWARQAGLRSERMRTCAGAGPEAVPACWAAGLRGLAAAAEEK
jgi:hypothetical protein